MTEAIEFKSQDRSLRRQMVIDAAIKVFHKRGYRTATLDDVANELGLTKPALYHYVSSKEHLLSLIYIQALESFFATVYEISGMDLSPPEKLRFFIRHHLNDIVIRNLAMFSVFFSEENQLPEKDFQKIQREKRKFTRVVEEIIDEGIEGGYFRALNARLLANAIIGMCNWLYRWYRAGSDSFTPEEIADGFINLLEGGYILRGDPFVGMGEEGPVPQERRPAPARRKRILRELKSTSEKVRILVEDLEDLV